MNKYDNDLMKRFTDMPSDNFLIIMIVYFICLVVFNNATLCNCILLAGLYLRYQAYKVNVYLAIAIVALGSFFHISYALLYLLPLVMSIKSFKENIVGNLYIIGMFIFLPIQWI